MKKLSFGSVVVSVCLLLSLLVPQIGYALTEDEIDSELAKIKKLEQQAQQSRKSAEAEKRRVSNQKVQEKRSIQQLLSQIEQQGSKLNELTEQIDQTESNLKTAGKELGDAQNRVEARNGLLQSRVRLMYTNGFVSYLEVLFSSTSFSDFLDRYQMLKTIVNQDKVILDANKKDRDLVAEKKRQIEEQLKQVQVLYAEAEQIKSRLEQQEKDKEKAVQILSKKEREFEEISAEQEKLLADLARKKSKLYAQKQSFSFSGGRLGYPLPRVYPITSGFGGRTDPINGRKANHTGIDLGAPQGTAILAAESGIVIIAQYVNGYGNTVVIDHGGGLWTWYAHIKNNGIKVEEGETVKRGRKIAEVGATGRVTGPHLHFEVRKNEVPVSPLPYLQ